MSGLPSIVWTRELLLQASGFDAPEDLRRAVKRTRQALSAKTPVKTFTRGEMSWTEGGEPDHRVRLEAAALVFDLANVRKPRADEPDAARPVNVQVILDARAPVQAHGVRLHLSSGDGENGHGGAGA